MCAQFSADFTLIAPGASSVTYDITLNAGQFSIPYATSLLLDMADGEGTLNVTTHGTFNGFIILGAGVLCLHALPAVSRCPLHGLPAACFCLLHALPAARCMLHPLHVLLCAGCMPAAYASL